MILNTMAYLKKTNKKKKIIIIKIKGSPSQQTFVIEALQSNFCDKHTLKKYNGVCSDGWLFPCEHSYAVVLMLFDFHMVCTDMPNYLIQRISELRIFLSFSFMPLKSLGLNSILNKTLLLKSELKVMPSF